MPSRTFKEEYCADLYVPTDPTERDEGLEQILLQCIPGASEADSILMWVHSARIRDAIKHDAQMVMKADDRKRHKDFFEAIANTINIIDQMSPVYQKNWRYSEIKVCGERLSSIEGLRSDLNKFLQLKDELKGHFDIVKEVRADFPSKTISMVSRAHDAWQELSGSAPTSNTSSGSAVNGENKFENFIAELAVHFDLMGARAIEFNARSAIHSWRSFAMEYAHLKP